MNRREFVRNSAWSMGALALPSAIRAAAQEQDLPCTFTTQDSQLMQTYEAALNVLSQNVRQLHPFASPVLIEGAVYPGIWLECAPQEGQVYSALRPDVARNNHLGFFARQKEDGQLPCNLKMNTVGYGQIQMVVPIAATAWELAERFGDSALLEKAYDSCGRWDDWLLRYRNTRKTGLCEGFCTYDTGHDNSPRWKGIPNQCPKADARICPPVPGVPRLCPDLSATVYGGRVALASMAKALGKHSEAEQWTAKAETIRKLIMEKLYVPEDGAFYDLDPQNNFIRIRGDVISRVLGEHVVDHKVFENVYHKEIRNPKAFWAPYPFPSIALDDPAFVRPIPRNSWGGASQALTALRAPRWMEFYGKPADLAWVMQRWVEAISRHIEFRQQMDPLNGDFTQKDPSGYSPAALVLFDFVWRLAGVRQEGDSLEWNVRPTAAFASAHYTVKLGSTTAELRYANNGATLTLGGKQIATVSGTARIVTTKDGKLRTATGIADDSQRVTLQQAGKKPHTFHVAPNTHTSLA